MHDILRGPEWAENRTVRGLALEVGQWGGQEVPGCERLRHAPCGWCRSRGFTQASPHFLCWLENMAAAGWRPWIASLAAPGGNHGLSSLYGPLFLFFSPLLWKASDMKELRTRALGKGRGGFPEPRWAMPLSSPSLMPLGEGHLSDWGPGPPPWGTRLTPDPGTLFAPYSGLCPSSGVSHFPRGQAEPPGPPSKGLWWCLHSLTGQVPRPCFCPVLLPTIKSGLWGQSLLSEGL